MNCWFYTEVSTSVIYQLVANTVSTTKIHVNIFMYLSGRFIFLVYNDTLGVFATKVLLW